MGGPFTGLDAAAQTENPSIRYGYLLRLALPSILLQSGAPIAITVQTALLGHKATELVAAWAVVATATNAATVVFNFLVVGVTAKVSKVVGARAWKQVGSRIRLALASALAMGVLAALLLWALQGPIFVLLRAAPEVVHPAQQYFALRVLGVPVQLLAMSTSGILQGYKRVNLVAGIQITRLCLDVLFSYVALFVLDLGIRGVGVGNLLAASYSAFVALACVVALPPEAGRGRIRIFSDVRPFFRILLRKLMPSSHLHSASAPLLQVDESAAQGDPEWGVRLTPASSWKSTQVNANEGVEAGQLLATEASMESLADESMRREGPQEEESLLPAPSASGVVAVRQPGKGWVAEEAADGDDDGEEEAVKESFWKFVWDGLSTMLRSALVQASFFMVLASVTALGTHAVAAHQVVMQLWMVTVYFADGFATAGTIVGSELAGKIDRASINGEHDQAVADLRTMSWRVLYMGTAVGFAISTCYFLFERSIVDIFTYDPRTKAELSRVWLFLMLVQPLNAIVFVYDGLIFAAQAFSYMATCLAVGFVLLFIPTIALANFYFHSLLSAWAAKGVLNVVRLVVASYKIHFDFLCPLPPKATLTEILASTESDEVRVVKVGQGVDSRDMVFRDWFLSRSRASVDNTPVEETSVHRSSGRTSPR